MKALLKNFRLCIVLVFTLWLTSYAWALQEVGKVSKVIGRVTLLRGGKLPAIKVVKGLSIFKGDILRTKRNSKVEVILKDGSILKIGPRSRVDITEYLKNDKEFKAVFELKRGTIGAFVSDKVVKTIKKGEINKFEVKTPIAVAGVRGTDFVVRHAGLVSNILVLKGEVYVFNKLMPQKVITVTENHITFVKRDRPPAPPKPVLPSEKKKVIKVLEVREAPSKKETKKGTKKGTSATKGEKVPSGGEISTGGKTSTEAKIPSEGEVPSGGEIPTGGETTATETNVSEVSLREIPALFEASPEAELPKEEIQLAETTPAVTEENLASKTEFPLLSESTIETPPITETAQVVSEEVETQVTPSSQTEQETLSSSSSSSDTTPPVFTSFSLVSVKPGSIVFKFESATDEAAQVHYTVKDPSGSEIVSGSTSDFSTSQEVEISVDESYAGDELTFEFTPEDSSGNQASATSFVLTPTYISTAETFEYAWDTGSGWSTAIQDASLNIAGILPNPDLSFSTDKGVFKLYVPSDFSTAYAYSTGIADYSSNTFLFFKDYDTSDGQADIFRLISDSNIYLANNFGTTLSCSGTECILESEPVLKVTPSLSPYSGSSFEYVQFGSLGTASSGPYGISYFLADNPSNNYGLSIFDFGDINPGEGLLFYGDTTSNFIGTLIDDGSNNYQLTLMQSELRSMNIGGTTTEGILVTRLLGEDPDESGFDINLNIGYAEHTGELVGRYVSIIENPSGSINEFFPDTLGTEFSSDIPGVTDVTNVSIISSKYSLFKDPNGNFGVYETVLSGDLTSEPDDIWHLFLSSQDSTSDFYTYSVFQGEPWEERTIKGDTYGVFLEKATGINGIFVGGVLGTYHDAYDKWEAGSVGSLLDTELYFNFLGTGDGVEKLETLGMPVAEIGSVDLSYSNPSCSGDAICSLNINNLKFLAFQMDKPPVVWLSSDVSGTFSGTPATGTTVDLSGSNSDVTISHLEFSLLSWDTSSNTWSAKLTPGSSFSGTVASFSLPGMYGFAGGSIDSSSNSFSGTASGVVEPDTQKPALDFQVLYVTAPSDFDSSLYAEVPVTSSEEVNFGYNVKDLSGNILDQGNLMGTTLPINIAIDPSSTPHDPSSEDIYPVTVNVEATDSWGNQEEITFDLDLTSSQLSNVNYASSAISSNTISSVYLGGLLDEAKGQLTFTFPEDPSYINSFELAKTSYLDKEFLVLYEDSTSDNTAYWFSAILPDKHLIYKAIPLPYSIVCTDSLTTCSFGSGYQVLSQKIDYSLAFNSFSILQLGSFEAGADGAVAQSGDEALSIINFGSSVDLNKGFVFYDLGDPVFGGRYTSASTPSGYGFNLVAYAFYIDSEESKLGIKVFQMGEDTSDTITLSTFNNIGSAVGSVQEINLIDATSGITSTFLSDISYTLSESNLSSLSFSSQTGAFELKTNGADTVGDFLIALGGSYSSASTPWYMIYDFDSSDISGVALATGSVWGNEVVTGGTFQNSIRGKTYGAYLRTDTDTPQTGIFVGETVGTFDPTSSKWQTVALGPLFETSIYLSMVDDTEGKTKLEDLGIPTVEIGKVSLSGSATGVSVTLNDVRFFAHSSSEPPTLWVTNNISGSYDPSTFSGTGTVVPLSGSSTNANISDLSFEFTSWDTSAGKWTAKIYPGTSFSGSVGTYTLQTIKGVAGGAIDTSGNSFSGTAAGIVRTN